MPPLSTSVMDASEDITEDRDGGVRKIIVNKGTGLKPLSGDKVNIRYVVFLENGNHFTSNRNSENEYFSFTIGKGEVVTAWEKALPTMQCGEKCILHCHHLYAYGSNGLPPLIRPNTNCLFEIELISFQGQDLSKKKDGGVMKSVIERVDACSDDFPYDNAKCTVSYECYTYPISNNETNNGNQTHNDTYNQAHNYNNHTHNETMSSLGYRLVQEKDHITLTLSNLDELTKGLNRALKKMRAGEKARVIVSPKNGYGSKGCERLSVPGYCQLMYIVCLHSFVNVRQHWEMSRQELMHEACVEKEKGAAYFKEGKHYEARKRYSRALLLVESVHFLKAELNSVCNNDNHGVDEDKEGVDDDGDKSDNGDKGEDIDNNDKDDDNDNKENENIISLETKTNITAITATSTETSSTTVPTPMSSSTTTQQQILTTPSSPPTTQFQSTTPLESTTTPSPQQSHPTQPTTIKDTEILIEMMTQKDALMATTLLNISVCHLKLNNFLRAFDTADRVLSLQPGNVKALYRRGMAHYHMANYDEARDDFRRLLSIQPTNSASLKQCRLCDKAIEKAKKKDKDIFQGMFQKFAFFDLQKGWEEGRAGRRDVFSEIGEWENGMAEGMMTLEQEMAAFGESMPPPGDAGGGDDGAHSDED